MISFQPNPSTGRILGNLTTVLVHAIHFLVGESFSSFTSLGRNIFFLASLFEEWCKFSVYDTMKSQNIPSSLSILQCMYRKDNFTKNFVNSLRKLGTHISKTSCASRKWMKEWVSSAACRTQGTVYLMNISKNLLGIPHSTQRFLVPISKRKK